MSRPLTTVEEGSMKDPTEPMEVIGTRGTPHGPFSAQAGLGQAFPFKDQLDVGQRSSALKGLRCLYLAFIQPLTSIGPTLPKHPHIPGSLTTGLSWVVLSLELLKRTG